MLEYLGGAGRITRWLHHRHRVSRKHVFLSSVEGRFVSNGLRSYYGQRRLTINTINAVKSRDMQSTEEAAESADVASWEKLPKIEEMNQSLCLGTILVEHPKRVTPEEIISQLPRIKCQQPNQLGLNVIFLLTPSFTSWAERNHEFLPMALQHMYSSPGQSQPRRVRSHIGIVDSLSAPLESYMRPPGRQMLPSYYEGVSFFTSHRPIPSESFKHDKFATIKRHKDDDEDEGPHITFRFYNDVHEYHPAAELQDGRGLSIQEYHLPLANTLFENGKESTLYKDSWDLAEDGDSIRRIDLSDPFESRERSNCTLESTSYRNSLTCSCVQITEPREVVSCMGNVISKLSGSEGNVLPASSDLEANIPELLANKRFTTSRNVQVYALVIPQGQMISRKVHPNDSLISQYGHLHRVTSGGGGWGNKAGLLSIDPAFGIPEHQRSMEVVAVGDKLTFFAIVEPLVDRKSELKSLRQGNRRAINHTMARLPLEPTGHIMVGVCPPKDDQNYSDTSLLKFSETAGETGQKLFVFTGFFVMLSEKPMIMHFPQSFDQEHSFSSTLGAPWMTFTARVTRERPWLSTLNNEGGLR